MMRDDLQLGKGLLQQSEDPRGVVRAPVVHDDDLELRGDSAPDFGGLPHHPCNIALLVEARNHHRQTHRVEPNSAAAPLQSRN